jgi:hypothetical protein
MKVVVNPDNSTTVSCNGSTVTITPPAPAGGSTASGGVSDPGTVSALIATRRRLGEARGLDDLARLLAEAPPAGEADAAGLERALVLHGRGEIDIDRVRRLLNQAGLGHLAIEITPATHRG